MISFADLQPRLQQVEQLGTRDFAFQCPRCGGRASVRSFGRGWSAKCPRCGNGKEYNNIVEASSGPSHRLSSNAAPENASAGRGTLADGPDSAAQPAQSSRNNVGQPAQKDGDDSEREIRSREPIDATASVAEADADAGIQASEEVSGDKGVGNLRSNVARDKERPFDNAAPAAGSLNGAGGGRSYHGRPKTQPDKALVPSRGIPAADDILKRKPPQNIEAEMSVLGAVFMDNECVATALRTLTIDDFYREAHREIFRGMMNLRRDGVAIDVVTLAAELRARNLLDAVGDSAYLAELAIFVPTSRHTQHYAQIVKAMAVKRDAATKLSELVSLAYDGVSVPALVGEMERVLRPFTSEISYARPQLLTFADSKRLADEAGARPHIIEDMLTVEDISGLAAKKGIGKSTLLRTIAVGVSEGQDVLGLRTNQTKVWYLDLEPGSQQKRHEALELLGWNERAGNLILTANAPVAGQPWAFEWLEEEIEKNKFGLVIIDTLFKFCRIDQSNDYSSGLYGSAPLEGIVKRTKAHILVAHHAPKNGNPNNPNASAADLFLGAVSIAGSFGVCLAMRRNRGNVSLFMDAPRYTRQVIEGEWILNKDPITAQVSLGESIKRHWLNAAMADFMYAAGQLEQPFVLRELDLDTLKKKEIWRVAKVLVKDGQLVEAGKEARRGGGMQYRIATGVPAVATTPERQGGFGYRD